MVLPSSGPLSLQDIEDEFGGTGSISISEYYGAATGVPASGTISISDFYGTSSYDPAAGYWGGGGYPNMRTIMKIAFATETLSQLTAQFSPPTQSLVPTSANRAQLAGATNAPTYGYFAGGGGIPTLFICERIDRLQYSNDTTSKIPAVISGSTIPPTFTPQPPTGYQGRRAHAAVESDSNAYFCGGIVIAEQPGNIFNPQPFAEPEYSTKVEKLQFSNDTVSSPGTDLPGGSILSYGMVMTGFNSSSYGYILGSETGNLYKLQFSNESTSAAATLPPANPGGGSANTSRNGAVQSNSDGYYIRTLRSSPLDSKVCKIPFTTDTETVTPSTLPGTRFNIVGVNNNSAGYFAGGAPLVPTFPPNNIPTNQEDDIFKFVFSTDTLSTLPSTLPYAVQSAGAVEGG